MGTTQKFYPPRRMRRYFSVNVRLTKEEYDKIKAQSKVFEASMGATVRSFIEVGLHHYKEDTEEG